MGSRGRYQPLDSDETRLPEGFQRVGYDANEQRYYYRDADGGEWEGEPGNRYGQLHRVGERPEFEGVPEVVIASQEREAWRYFLPFLLLVGAFMLFVLRFTHGGTGHGDGGGDAIRPSCKEGEDVHRIVRGDTCYDIATGRGIEVDDLQKANEDLDCDNLPIGRWLCVPEGSAEISASASS